MAFVQLPDAPKNAVLQELRTFLSGATNASKIRNVSRSAIFLLQHFPASRDGVLEHLCNLFDEAINNYVLKLELDDNSTIASNVSADEIIIEEVHTVLSDFVKSNPDAWAPIIIKWALDLLGFLSSKYADRRVVPHSSSLQEILQLWIGCCPTRTLIELTSLCLSTLIGRNPDMCIDALLETSVRYSPHFDWVVAHLGSRFPTTVVTRVLACGLKDYCRQEVSEEPQKVPKIASVVGILGHLAAQHGEDIRKALVTLFHESFASDPTKEQMSTVPFLLHLASMSDMLLHVITSEFITLMTPEVLEKLSHQVSWWQSNQIPGTESLTKLVVHLLLRSEREGHRVIQNLLAIATNKMDGQTKDCLSPKVSSSLSFVRKRSVLHDRRACWHLVVETAGRILDHLLLEVQHQVHGGRTDIPLLHCIKDHMAELCLYIKKDFSSEASWVLNILKFICMQGGELVTMNVLGQLLCIVDGPQELSDFLNLLHYVELSQPNVLRLTVSSKIADMKSGRTAQTVRLVDNLAHLAKAEGEKCVQIFLPSLSALAAQALHPDPYFAAAVVRLLARCTKPEKMSIASLLRVGSAVVAYFFQLVKQSEQNRETQNMFMVCRNLLAKLCQQPALQHAILRMLVTGVLSSDNAVHFGGNFLGVINERAPRRGTTFVSLLKENQKHCSSITVPQSHSSIFHAGIIGNGLRPKVERMVMKADVQLRNRQLFLDALYACCSVIHQDMNVAESSIAGTKILSLMMVEIVSPDVMFNGLPWPEEENAKVTIERDLLIKRQFDHHPIIWDILFLIASVHPSLCYCSVLLRAIMAVVMAYWNSCQEKAASNCPKHLQVTQQVVHLMAMGHLLPDPLGSVDAILPLLGPFEVFCLLSDIWQYMKDHVPSPALFTVTDPSTGKVWRDALQVEKKYTDRLRFILLENIHKLGTFYAKYFGAR